MKLSNLGYLIKRRYQKYLVKQNDEPCFHWCSFILPVLTGAAVIGILKCLKSIVDKVGDSNETTVYMEDKATDAGNH